MSVVWISALKDTFYYDWIDMDWKNDMCFLDNLFATAFYLVEGGVILKELYIKEKVMSLSGKFTVKDYQEKDVYYVEGSFMKIPKTFSIMNTSRKEIALITKKIFTFLPKFFVHVNGHEVLTIKKEFTFFKPRYTIDAAGIEVQGNWWEMNFQVFQQGERIATVRKKWFTWGDSYEVQIVNEEMEATIIALVVAIDCVKADQAAVSSSTSTV